MSLNFDWFNLMNNNVVLTQVERLNQSTAGNITTHAGAARGALRPEGELLGCRFGTIVGPASRTSLGAGLSFWIEDA